MFFLVKKWLGLFLMPLPFSLLMMFVGLFLLWLTKKQTTGKILISISFVIIISFSNRPTSIALIRPLEQQFPPYQNQPVDCIIVLGHGHASDPTVPLSSQLTEAAYARIMEGIRIKKLNPQAKLILSGSVLGDPISGAEMYARIAEVNGIPRSEMSIVESPKDTEQEVKADAELVLGKRTAVVTSASHMPRAVDLFQKAGLTVIPAPTQFVGKYAQEELPMYAYLPSGRYLMYSEMAIHEWIGQIWNSLRN